MNNMKINGDELLISEYKIKKKGDDTVIYSKLTNKMLVLNETSLAIFRKIEDAHCMNVDITSKDIAHELIKEYNIDISRTDEITKDVEETLEMFMENILVKITSARKNEL